MSTYSITPEQATAIAFRAVQRFVALCDRPEEQPRLTFNHVEKLRQAIADTLLEGGDPYRDVALGAILQEAQRYQAERTLKTQAEWQTTGETPTPK
jgi:hypothetical protein